MAYFWKHLSDAGMLENDYSEDGASGIVAGVNIPSTPYKSVGTVVSDEDWCCGGLGNIYLMKDFSASTGVDVLTNDDGIPSISALALDKKLDDGLRASGEMLLYGDCGYGSDPFSPVGTCMVVAKIEPSL